MLVDQLQESPVEIKADGEGETQVHRHQQQRIHLRVVEDDRQSVEEMRFGFVAFVFGVLEVVVVEVDAADGIAGVGMRPRHSRRVVTTTAFTADATRLLSLMGRVNLVDERFDFGVRRTLGHIRVQITRLLFFHLDFLSRFSVAWLLFLCHFVHPLGSPLMCGLCVVRREKVSTTPISPRFLVTALWLKRGVDSLFVLVRFFQAQGISRRS